VKQEVQNIGVEPLAVWQ